MSRRGNQKTRHFNHERHSKSFTGEPELISKRDKLKFPDPLKEPIICDSLSEYVCISMLEKYTPWRAIQGVTFQIPIGRCTFDFLIDNKLIEYHPISLKREFLSDSLSSILSATRKLDRNSKLELLNALVEEFKEQYIKRRGQVASADSKHSSHQVLCVFTPEEFIRQVLIPNSSFVNLNPDSLCLEFRRLQKENKGLV